MSALLEVEELRVSYGKRRRPRPPAVDGVSLTVGAGASVGLVGESGSGKTSLGRAVLGLVRPSGGRITFRGTDVTTVPAERRGGLTAELQAVFQNPNSSLNPARTIGASVLEPAAARRGSGTGTGAGTAADLLRRVGLPADAAGRYPHEFSGGQLQRIAIARALANSPSLIVCDEPVSALDLSTQAQILNLLTDLRAELGISYLFIGHNLAAVRHVCDEVVVLYRGRTMESGPAATVITRPAHPYTRALVASSPVADVEQQRIRRELRLRLAAPGAAADAPAGVPPAGCPFAPRCPHAAGVCATARPALVAQAGHRVACHVYDPRSGHPLSREDPPPAAGPAARSLEEGSQPHPFR